MSKNGGVKYVAHNQISAKGKKQSTDKSETVAKILIVNALLQLIKSVIDLINRLLD